MNLENLIPHSGNHSIQSAVLALEWAESMPLDFIETLRGAVRPLIEGSFPKEDPQRTVSFNIDAQGMTAPTPSNEVSGYVYSRFATDGSLSKQIQITRTGCLFIVSDYLRWADLIAEVNPIFERVLATLPSTSTVSAVGLQYTDRFVWKGSLAELNLKEIFLENSPYISSHSLTCQELWHSHHGYFENVTQPAPSKRLDNINIALTDSPEGRAIDILTSHRLAFNEAVNAQSLNEIVFVALTDMHNLNKDIFGQLFTTELLIKIGMATRS